VTQREREGETERDRERDSDRERQRKRQRERQRKRDRERVTQRERERDTERERERDRERERQRERDRERKTDRERRREEYRERERERRLLPWWNSGSGIPSLSHSWNSQHAGCHRSGNLSGEGGGRGMGNRLLREQFEGNSVCCGMSVHLTVCSLSRRSLWESQFRVEPWPFKENLSSNFTSLFSGVFGRRFQRVKLWEGGYSDYSRIGAAGLHTDGWNKAR